MFANTHDESAEKYRQELLAAAAGKTPVELAASCVEEFFAKFFSSRDPLIGIGFDTLDGPCRVVEAAIERDWRAEHGDDSQAEWSEAEAWYLIGVQVGLRLRVSR